MHGVQLEITNQGEKTVKFLVFAPFIPSTPVEAMKDFSQIPVSLKDHIH